MTQQLETPVVWCWSAKGGTGTTTIAAALAARTVHGLERAGVEEDGAGGPVLLVDLRGDAAALLGLTPEPNLAQRARTESSQLDEAPEGQAGERLLRAAAQSVSPGLDLLDLHDAEPGSMTDPAGERFGALVASLAEASAAVVIDAGTDETDAAERVKQHVPNLAAVEVTRNCYLALRRAQQRPASGKGEVMLVEEPHRVLRSRDAAAALDAAVLHRVDWDPRVARGIDAGTLTTMLPTSLRRMELPTALRDHLAEITPPAAVADVASL